MTVMLSITAVFSAFAGYIFGTFRDKAKIIIQRYGVRRCFPLIPKYVTGMILSGCFTFNSVFAPVDLELFRGFRVKQIQIES